MTSFLTDRTVALDLQQVIYTVMACHDGGSLPTTGLLWRVPVLWARAVVYIVQGLKKPSTVVASHGLLTPHQ